jgi:hypothetical protein
MAKTVTDYQVDIMNAQSEIQKIQTLCAHDLGYECVMYSWRIGSSYPTRLCLACKLPLSGITEEESEKARRESYVSFQTQEDTNG